MVVVGSIVGFVVLMQLGVVPLGWEVMVLLKNGILLDFPMVVVLLSPLPMVAYPYLVSSLQRGGGCCPIRGG